MLIKCGIQGQKKENVVVLAVLICCALANVISWHKIVFVIVLSVVHIGVRRHCTWQPASAIVVSASSW